MTIYLGALKRRYIFRQEEDAFMIIGRFEFFRCVIMHLDHTISKGFFS
jgi:hypothetical protein